MGMTDRQYDGLMQNLLRRLQIAQEQIKKDGSTKELDLIVKDIEDQLKKP